MSLQAKIEAVIYASEEPVTLQQLVALLGDEAGAELDQQAADQGLLPLGNAGSSELAAENSGQVAEEPATDATAKQAASLEIAFAGSGERPHVMAAAVELGGIEDDPGLVARGADGDSAHAAEPVDSGVADTSPVGTVETVPDATETSAEPIASPESVADVRRTREWDRAVRDHIRRAVNRLIREYAEGDRGIEIREVASGYRMATKPEFHDAVRGFVKSLKPALKLTLPALETLAVVAYKQPVTAAELSEIRGVDSSGVLGGLLARKLIATAGRKQVIGRPMLYKTTRDFLLRFGLKDVNELPSMDEFERMANELVDGEDLPETQGDARTDEAATLIEQANVRGDAEHIREVTGSQSSADAVEASDTDESDDALAAEVAADASTDIDRNATAETAAGGNHGRSNEPAAAAPLHTTQAGHAAPGHGSDQGSAAGTADTRAEEGEWGSGT